MRVLVTSGAGFIGANFVHWTLRHRPDADVVVLDALSYADNQASLDGLDVEVVQGDVADAERVDTLVRQGPAGAGRGSQLRNHGHDQQLQQ